MIDPEVRLFSWQGAHRLVPSCFSVAGAVFAGLAASQADLSNLIVLERLTNNRIRGEDLGLIGISTYELVYGIPNAHIVNGAFSYTSAAGSRFNDSTRGAWYAADLLEASLAEVTYHKAKRLSNVVCPREKFGRPSADASTFDDWLANFDAEFHVLEAGPAYAGYLQPEPVPACYATSQALARQLLQRRSNGLAYPSVRSPGANCLACFRPALVYSPRKSQRLQITFTANPVGYDSEVLTVAN